MKKLGEFSKYEMKSFASIQVDEANLLIWQGLVVLVNPPDKVAFRKINFPPKVTFKTKICHPDMDGKGHVACLSASD